MSISAMLASECSNRKTKNLMFCLVQNLHALRNPDDEEF